MGETTGVRQHALSMLRDGAGYREIGERLGMSPGLAYLIVTGVPADGSDSLSAEDLRKEGLMASSQDLCNPPAAHPVQKETTLAFIRRRAATGLDPAGSPPAGGPTQ